MNIFDAIFISLNFGLVLYFIKVSHNEAMTKLDRIEQQLKERE